jgi:hypothetical protein
LRITVNNYVARGRIAPWKKIIKRIIGDLEKEGRARQCADSEGATGNPN